jgi:hypothetical protein
MTALVWRENYKIKKNVKRMKVRVTRCVWDKNLPKKSTHPFVSKLKHNLYLGKK